MSVFNLWAEYISWVWFYISIWYFHNSIKKPLQSRHCRLLLCLWENSGHDSKVHKMNISYLYEEGCVTLNQQDKIQELTEKDLLIRCWVEKKRTLSSSSICYLNTTVNSANSHLTVCTKMLNDCRDHSWVTKAGKRIDFQRLHYTVLCLFSTSGFYNLVVF